MHPGGGNAGRFVTIPPGGGAGGDGGAYGMPVETSAFWSRWIDFPSCCRAPRRHGSDVSFARAMAIAVSPSGGAAPAAYAGGAERGEARYVPDGQGKWVPIEDASYQYVPPGTGHAPVVMSRPPVSPWCWCGACALLALAVAAIMLWLGVGAATTTRQTSIESIVSGEQGPGVAPGVKKDCLFWGDPHILTFDGQRPSFYGDGEYWIVKNKDIHIQGRYMGTKYTLGLAATQKVAVGGPFLKGHTIEVEPMEAAYGGHIFVDGQDVLNEFGTFSVADGLNTIAVIKYDGNGERIDKATSVWPLRVVHMKLPLGVELTVFRWGNYVDMKIRMPRPEGPIDGSCGNFNGDPADDTTALVFGRIGARVSDEELMFRHRAVVMMTHEEAVMFQKTCPMMKIELAKAACDKALPTTVNDAQRLSCAFDFCFGMDQHALQTAKTFATPQDLAAANTKDYNWT